MTKQIIGIGTIPNDGTGDNLYDAGNKINDNFTECYDNISTNETNIAANTLNIATLPTIGINYIGENTDISTTSTTYVDVGITLNYTPKRNTTKLKISFNSLLRLDANQHGVRYELNYSLDNGSSYNIVTLYMKTISLYAGVYDDGISSEVYIDVPVTPTTPLQCIFKINAKVLTASINATLLGTEKSIILEVQEIVI